MSTREALKDLNSHGDTLDLGDGRTLRLVIEVDEDTTLNDYDSDGKVQWTRSNVYSGHSTRPDGFTGRARIIIRDGNNSLWWEPYFELTEEQIKAEQPRIVDLVTYGWKVITLEILQGEDFYGKPIVVNAATLGGVDLSGDDNYLASVVSDLASELGVVA